MKWRAPYRKRRRVARYKRIYMRVTGGEKAAIERRAAARGMSTTAHLLDCEARWALGQAAMKNESDD